MDFPPLPHYDPRRPANGLPYSESATVTEYLDRLSAYGDEWLVVLTTVDDPAYLSQPFITSTHFKREADGSKWAPVACETGKWGGEKLEVSLQ